MADLERSPRIYLLPVDSSLVANEITTSLEVQKLKDPLRRFLEHSSRISGIEGFELLGISSDNYRPGAKSLEVSSFIDLTDYGKEKSSSGIAFRALQDVFNRLHEEAMIQYPEIDFSPHLWIINSREGIDFALNSRLNQPGGFMFGVESMPMIEEGDRVLSAFVAKVRDIKI